METPEKKRNALSDINKHRLMNALKAIGAVMPTSFGELTEQMNAALSFPVTESQVRFACKGLGISLRNPDSIEERVADLEGAVKQLTSMDLPRMSDTLERMSCQPAAHLEERVAKLEADLKASQEVYARLNADMLHASVNVEEPWKADVLKRLEAIEENVALLIAGPEKTA